MVAAVYDRLLLFHRHPRERGDPGAARCLHREERPRRARMCYLPHLPVTTDWIPAFAGMTGLVDAG